MEFLSYLLTAIGGAAAALALAAWLAREWIGHQLAKGLEKYKEGLVQKTEVLKTELAIFAHEQNVGMERIDAQRSDAIQAIWAKLTAWQEILFALTAPNVNRERNPGSAVGDFYLVKAKELVKAADALSIEVRNRAILAKRVPGGGLRRILSGLLEAGVGIEPA